MAEKIKLFEIDIDSKNLLTSLANTRKEIEALQKAQKENLRATAEEQKAFEANAVVLKQLSGEYRNNQKVLDALSKSQTQSIDTVDDARKALSAVSVLWAQVTKLEGEDSVQSKELGARKLELTNRLKELEGATGDTRRNVGNYTASILEAAKASGGFQGVLGGFGNTLNTAAKGFQAAKGGSTGFIAGIKGIGGAITATGIGALVQIVVLLVQSFKSLKVVTDPLEQAFNSISFVINEIVQRGTQLVGAFGFLLKGDFKNAANQATTAVDGLGKALGDAADQGARLKAEQQDLEDNANRLKVVNAENQREIDRLLAQSKDRTKSEKERIALVTEANRLEKENFEANVKQNDKVLSNLQKTLQVKTKLTQAELDLFFSQNATEKQRAAIQKKIDIDEEKFIEYSEKRVEAASQEGKSLALQDKLAGRLNILEEQRIANQEKAAAKAQALREKQEAARLKANEQIIKNIEDEIKIFEVRNQSVIKADTELTAELVAEEVDRVSKLSDLREKLYRTQLEQGVITKGEFEKLLSELNAEFDTFTAGLSSTAAEQAITKLNDAILSGRRKLLEGKGTGLLTVDEVNKQVVLLKDLQKSEEAVLTQRFNDNQIREEQYLLELATLRKNYNDQITGLNTQLLTEEQQREAFNFQTRLSILQLQGESELNIRREQLLQQQDVEVQAAIAIGGSVSDVNEKYRLLNQELDREAVNSRLAIAANYTAAFSQLVGENTAFGKLAASAGALINTYFAITEALKAPTLAQRIAGVAFAAATGFKSVIDINKTKVPTAPKPTIPKFEDGGFIIGGKYHSSGGTTFTGSDGSQFETEKDEAMFVLNRNATSKLKALSSLNQLFPMSKRIGTMQSGGFPQTLAQDMSRGISTGDLLTGLQSQQIVVDVKDIITQTERRVQVVDSATI